MRIVLGIVYVTFAGAAPHGVGGVDQPLSRRLGALHASVAREAGGRGGCVSAPSAPPRLPVNVQFVWPHEQPALGITLEIAFPIYAPVVFTVWSRECHANHQGAAAEVRGAEERHGAGVVVGP